LATPLAAEHGEVGQHPFGTFPRLIWCCVPYARGRTLFDYEEQACLGF